MDLPDLGAIFGSAGEQAQSQDLEKEALARDLVHGVIAMRVPEDTHFDTIVKLTGLSIADATLALFHLELGDKVRQHPGKRFSLKEAPQDAKAVEPDSALMTALAAFNVTENPPQPQGQDYQVIGSFDKNEAKRELALSMFEAETEENEGPDLGAIFGTDSPDDDGFMALARFIIDGEALEGQETDDVWAAQFAEPPAVKVKQTDSRAIYATEKAEKIADGSAHNVMARKIANLIQAGDDVDTVVDKCRPNLREGKYDWPMVMKWAGEALHSFSPIQSGDVRLAVRDEVIMELEEITELHLDTESKLPSEDGPTELLERTGQNARNLDLFAPEEAEGKTEAQRARMAHYIKVRLSPGEDGWVIKGSIGSGPTLNIETITGPHCNMMADKYLKYCAIMAKAGQWPRRLQELIEEEGPVE